MSASNMRRSTWAPTIRPSSSIFQKMKFTPSPLYHVYQPERPAVSPFASRPSDEESSGLKNDSPDSHM